MNFENKLNLIMNISVDAEVSRYCAEIHEVKSDIPGSQFSFSKNDISYAMKTLTSFHYFFSLSDTWLHGLQLRLKHVQLMQLLKLYVLL